MSSYLTLSSSFYPSHPSTSSLINWSFIHFSTLTMPLIVNSYSITTSLTLQILSTTLISSSSMPHSLLSIIHTTYSHLVTIKTHLQIMILPSSWSLSQTITTFNLMTPLILRCMLSIPHWLKSLFLNFHLLKQDVSLNHHFNSTQTATLNSFFGVNLQC
jgi:hypothetical protein